MPVVSAAMPDDTQAIELWPCGYAAQCRVQNCKARATTIARGVDSGGRPTTQYELCDPHAEQLATREQRRGRQIILRP